MNIYEYHCIIVRLGVIKISISLYTKAWQSRIKLLIRFAITWIEINSIGIRSQKVIKMIIIMVNSSLYWWLLKSIWPENDKLLVNAFNWSAIGTYHTPFSLIKRIWSFSRMECISARTLLPSSICVTIK